MIEEIRELHTRNQMTIRNVNRINNSFSGTVRWALGYDPFDEDEKAKAEIIKSAQKVVKFLKTGNDRPMDVSEEDMEMLRQTYIATEASVVPLNGLRKSIESEMKKKARKLDIYPWVNGIYGLSEYGLAQIIGESGDLSNYKSVAAVWKRFGLACDETGRRQGLVPSSVTGEARKQMYIDDGYVPRRRSIMYCIGESIVKVNKGTYNAHYKRRKDYENARTDERAPKSKMHAHKRAMRYATKMLLKDLYLEWIELHGITDIARELKEAS
jgi:hypothetical protein